jgi:hypothetical protein
MAWDCMTERDPDTNMVLFGHSATCWFTHGIHIIENLNLEALASAGYHEFCFIAIPLKFRRRQPARRCVPWHFGRIARDIKHSVRHADRLFVS